MRLTAVIRNTWPVGVVVEGAVGGVLTAAAVLGAPVAAMVTCGLLFGVLAPVLGILVSWLAK